MNSTIRPPGRAPRAIAAMAALLLLAPGSRAQESVQDAGDPVVTDARIAGKDVPVPSRKKYVAPQYPAAAAADGIRGIVIVRLTIDEDGRVLDAQVTRSIPGLDEAAVAAVKLWEYEPSKVDGKPVKVLLTQSITFTLRLPTLQREVGVPELKSGGSPPVPTSLATEESASVAVTLGPEGEVVDATIVAGDSVVAEALLRAVKSWRFQVSPATNHSSFTVSADWTPGPRPALVLKAFDYRPGESRAAAGLPAGGAPEPATPAQGGSSPPRPDAGDPPDREPPPDLDTEVIPARPEPPVREEGVSSVSEVVLGENIPDLARGRRPVWPPLARLGNITGDVVVRFTVDLAGKTTVHSAEGHELLKDAAEQAVQTWLFRRTAIDMVDLVATFKFNPDRTVAMVERVP